MMLIDRSLVNMFKLAIIFSFVLCLLGLSMGLFDHILYSNYNIGIEKVPKRDHTYGRKQRKWLKELKFLYSLSREDSDKIVCIVEGKKNGTAELNPRHIFGGLKFNYGFIPTTDGLTESIANALFGNPVEQSQNHATYRLIARSELPATNNKIVFINMRFDNNNRVREFRIRSRDLESTDWIMVQ